KPGPLGEGWQPPARAGKPGQARPLSLRNVVCFSDARGVQLPFYRDNNENETKPGVHPRRAMVVIAIMA
ncbi:uncharacterized protein METZ01_LOCUS500869, partial [marine metagenome]